jgi:hypothetical protein
MLAGVMVLFAGETVFSNPVAPVPATDTLLLSEVQVIDSTHWTVEFIYSSTPLTSDTVTKRFYLVYPGISPIFRPLVNVNKNGYALITPAQYPTVTFHPGDKVSLRRDLPKGTVDTVDTWECTIDPRIKPTQSMSAFVLPCTDPVFLTPSHYTTWLIDASPTLGSANDLTGVYGSIKIFVCDNDSNPIANYSGYYLCLNSTLCGECFTDCPFSTDSAGWMYFGGMVSTQSVGSFTIDNYNIGPFSAIPDTTLTFICKLNGYTGVRSSIAEARQGSLKILSIPSQLSSGLIVFTGNGSAEYYVVSVFSVSGKQIFNKRIASTGSGTYTVAWSGSKGTKVPPGSYIARVSTQSNSMERSFSVK